MTIKTPAAVFAAALALAAVGCKSDGGQDVDSTSANAPVPMDAEASLTAMEPYTNYMTIQADGKSYLVSNNEAASAIRAGQMPPASRTVMASDDMGNEFVIVDSGAVTAADIMAGYEARNGKSLTRR